MFYLKVNNVWEITNAHKKFSGYHTGFWQLCISTTGIVLSAQYLEIE
jgi:hypothetical protein